MNKRKAVVEQSATTILSIPYGEGRTKKTEGGKRVITTMEVEEEREREEGCSCEKNRCNVCYFLFFLICNNRKILFLWFFTRQ